MGIPLSVKQQKVEILKCPEKGKVWEFFNPFYVVYRPQVFERTNIVYRAYRYGLDHEGLKGKNLDANRFEWVLREKGKGTRCSYEEKAIQNRLNILGYKTDKSTNVGSCCFLL